MGLGRTRVEVVASSRPQPRKSYDRINKLITRYSKIQVPVGFVPFRFIYTYVNPLGKEPVCPCPWDVDRTPLNVPGRTTVLQGSSWVPFGLFVVSP